MKHISLFGIALRFVFALLLILATYNPTGKSYYHWVAENWSNLTPYIAIAGLGLLIGWVVYLNATLRSLGFAGLLLAGAFLACFVWLLVYWGWLDMDKYSSIAWVSEILLAILLTVGMCWSIIRRMISGQVDMDDVDDRT
jgi:hypothetical protein